MQKILYHKLVFVTTFAFMCVTLFSCSKDEAEDIIENIPLPDEPDEPIEDDSAKYDIVGCWVATYTWTYSGIVSTITMDINKDGTLSFLEVSTNENNAPFLGGGKWEYNKSEHNWTLKTSDSLVSGTYHLVGNQLISTTYFEDGSSRTVIFKKQ